MDGRGKEGRGSCLGWALACGREGRGWSELDGYVLMMPSVGNPGLLTDQRDHAAVDISHMANCSPYPPKPPPPPSKTHAAATPSTIGRLACTCTLVASTLIRNLLQFRRRGRAGLGLTTPSLLLVVSIVLSALSGAMATCPTYTSWIRPDGWDGIHP